jgi:hypothetical protein
MLARVALLVWPPFGSIKAGGTGRLGSEWLEVTMLCWPLPPLPGGAPRARPIPARSAIDQSVGAERDDSAVPAMAGEKSRGRG